MVKITVFLTFYLIEVILDEFYGVIGNFYMKNLSVHTK